MVSHPVESFIMGIAILISIPVLATVMLTTFRHMAASGMKGLNKIFGAN